MRIIPYDFPCPWNLNVNAKSPALQGAHWWTCSGHPCWRAFAIRHWRTDIAAPQSRAGGGSRAQRWPTPSPKLHFKDLQTLMNWLMNVKTMWKRESGLIIFDSCAWSSWPEIGRKVSWKRNSWEKTGLAEAGDLELLEARSGMGE